MDHGAGERTNDCGANGASRQALDLPHLCRAFDRARIQSALPAEPGQGTDRPLDRFRLADPDRFRQRPSARPRRGRQGRGRDLAHRRHAGAVRRDPARLDEYVDDHQRDRALADGALHRDRRRAGRAARPAPGHDPERHHQGISGPRRLCVPARRLSPADQGPDPLLRPRDAEVEPDERVLLPFAGGGRDAGAGIELRAGDSDRGARAGAPIGRGRRRGLRQCRRGHVVLRQRRHALRHRTGEDAGVRRALGRDHPRPLRGRRSAEAPVPLWRSGQLARLDRAAARKQRLPHPDRNAVGRAVARGAGARGAIARLERGARPAAAVRPAMVPAPAADHGL